MARISRMTKLAYVARMTEMTTTAIKAGMDKICKMAD